VRRSVIFALSATALVALIPLSCTQDFSVFEPAGSSGSGGAASSSSASTGTSTSTSTSSTSSSASSSGSGGPTCKTNAECDDLNPCTQDTCNASQCQHKALTGPGPDDGNPCTKDLCTNGVASHDKLPADMSCGPGNQVCDANGNCVGCNSPNQCGAAPECKITTCDNHTCGTGDAVTGTQCSKGKCDGAGNCYQCLTTPDCGGGAKICANHVCIDTCSDGMVDGQETDVDCGGPTCAKCANSKKCMANSDCSSTYCVGNVCVVQCMNGVMDGAETDVD